MRNRQHVGIIDACKITGKTYGAFMRRVELGQIPYFMDGPRKRFYVDELQKQPESSCHIKSSSDQKVRNTKRTYRSVSEPKPKYCGFQLTKLSGIKP